ncbi:MAG: ABC transporter substrate-binding protein [Acidipropionibacterium sp.]|jgi:branched-chain amino acid transport system substrate-binding protein|nr:ABC transporter substrate-binding protein [Acidipropionibacterium sp.]
MHHNSSGRTTSSEVQGSSSTTLSRGRKLALKAAAASLSVMVLAACSSGSSGGTSASPSDSASGGATGTLKIGAVFPQTGSLALLGPAAIAGAKQAVDDANAASPSFKTDLIVKDSGDTTTDIASSSTKALLSSGVSAILAPESSAVVKTVFSQITNAQVPFITPAATDPSLTNPNKSNGYFFRTVPSDILQGQALAQKIVSDGKKNVSILYMNEAYGTGLNTQIVNTLKANNVKVAADVPFTPNSTNFNAEVSKVLAPKPDALVVISFDEIKSIAAALQQNKFDFKNFYGTDGNNGILGKGDPDITGAQFSTPGVNPDASFKAKLDKINGKTLNSYSYAAEAYDAATVVALAAAQGKSTAPQGIQKNLITVTKGGTKCTSFKACYDLIQKGTDIDYDGVSGPIDWNESGDVTKASISFYKTTGPDNKTVWVSQQTSSL